MSNYSPSPWKFEKINDNEYDDEFQVTDANNQPVCNNAEYYAYPVSVDDMKLIAITPEMFELLPELEEILKNYRKTVWEEWSARSPDVSKMLNKIRSIRLRVK